MSHATATEQWVKVETFKASGCAAAAKVKLDYNWIGVCAETEPGSGEWQKKVCTSGSITETSYTDKACTSAKSGATPESSVAACSMNDDKWDLSTCGSAPPTYSDVEKYGTNQCTTLGYSVKVATGTCLLDQAKSGSGNTTTWAAGSTKYLLEGTGSKTTGLKILKYTTNDCTGASSTASTMGSVCADLGDGFYTNLIASKAPSSDTASRSKRSMLSPIAGFICTASVLKYFF